MYTVQLTKFEDVIHYGIKRKSGRYPYGSGERPFQSERQFKGQLRRLNSNYKQVQSYNSKSKKIDDILFGKLTPEKILYDIVDYQALVDKSLKRIEDAGITLEKYKDQWFSKRQTGYDTFGNPTYSYYIVKGYQFREKK